MQTNSTLSSEARAAIFCHALRADFSVNERLVKWNNLALFIEQTLSQSHTEEKPVKLKRGETGQFRSITYDPGTKSVYIHLHKKDFFNPSTYLFSSTEWSQDPEDSSWMHRTKKRPVLRYAVHFPRLKMSYTRESKPVNPDDTVLDTFARTFSVKSAIKALPRHPVLPMTTDLEANVAAVARNRFAQVIPGESANSTLSHYSFSSVIPDEGTRVAAVAQRYFVPATANPATSTESRMVEAD